jgi:uncharacterized protein
MDFGTIASNTHNFYVPAFAIVVDGRDLIQQRVEVFNLTVNTTLEGADDFSFTVNNPFDVGAREFRYIDNELFDPGKEVEIRLGYGDRGGLARVLLGIITGHDISFPANGLSQITVRGFDLSHKMMKGKNSASWGADKKPVKYSDIVKDIARKQEYGFDVANVIDSGKEHPQVKQKNESDYDFIKKRLAEEIGFEVFVIDRDIFFRPRANDQKEVVTTLSWGRTLVSFSPQINTADQVSEVEVRGWDPAQQKAIIGKATRGQERGRDGNRKSGGEEVESRQGKFVKHVWKPMFTQTEANDLAKALLEKTALEYVTGNGECLGIPEIRAGKNIALAGLGDKFSRTYYIEKATHSISTSGYRTTFSVKENTI